MKKVAYLIFIVFLANCCNVNNEREYLSLKFDQEPKTESDSLNTLQSLRTVGQIFNFNYFGDYKELLTKENEQLKERAKLACSIFSVHNYSCHLMARNLDLPFGLKNIVVGKYNPSDGYQSFSLCALDFLVGNNRINLDSLSRLSASGILRTPFYAMDGMNEMGLCVGIAAVPSQEIKPDSTKEKIDILLLNRLMLDHAKNVDEAIEIAQQYNVFDENINTISHHYLIADADGKSVVIEYQNGEMQIVQNPDNYQIITNAYIKDKTLKERNIHNRYIKIYKQLNKKNVNSYQDALNLLQDVSWYKGESGTQWSVVYDLKDKQGYLTVQGNFNDTYAFRFE